MPRGVYQYKFIVDNNWYFAENQPRCKDIKGNINNGNCIMKILNKSIQITEIVGVIMEISSDWGFKRLVL